MAGARCHARQEPPQIDAERESRSCFWGGRPDEKRSMKYSVDSPSGIATLQYLFEITLNIDHPLWQGVFYRLYAVPDGRNACRSGLRNPVHKYGDAPVWRIGYRDSDFICILVLILYYLTFC